MIQQIALDLIFTRKDARKLDDAAVRGLVSSISEVGIINPLRVRPVIRHVAGVETDAYEVTAGAHRLKAARKIGLETVPCIVADDDDLHAELAMIDENLQRAELTPAERASYTARRKAIYETLHPETVLGAALKRGVESPYRQVGETADRFTASTAEATGKSERTIQRDAERGEKITEQALSVLKGTALDKGSELDKLKKIEPEKQLAWVQRNLEAEEDRRSMERKMANENRILQISDAERFAEWILARADLSELDVVVGWLNTIKGKDVAAILRREAA